jgi:lipid A oxidase
MASNRRSPSASIAVAAAGLLAGALVTALSAAPALAEVQISVYGGMNSNFSSKGELNGPVTDERTFDWEGKSFQMPPYWGAQLTYWFNRGASWGIAIDYTHAKAYADLNFADPTVPYSHLEFSDGNNLALLNLMYRFEPIMGGRAVPFVGIGGGVAIPHVEVTLKAPFSRTFEYQLAGGAAQVLAGLEFKLDEAWSVFAEGKLSYSHLDTELENGGKFKTYLWSPQLAIGLSYRFGR